MSPIENIYNMVIATSCILNIREIYSTLMRYEDFFICSGEHIMR